jgi:hypothetical protein
LIGALADLDARYRDLTGRVLRPETRALEGEGHHLLLTRCGPLDVLGRIGTGGYQELLAESVTRSLGGITIHVLGLEAFDPGEDRGESRQGSCGARDLAPHARRAWRIVSS